MSRGNDERLSRRAVAVISFFSGAGILSVGAGLGASLPTTVRFLLANSKSVVQVSLALSVLGAVYLLGRPVSNLLSKGGR